MPIFLLKDRKLPFSYKKLSEFVHQVVDEFDHNVHLVEIDIEEDQEVAEAAGIMGTPCVQFFKDKDLLK